LKNRQVLYKYEGKDLAAGQRMLPAIKKRELPKKDEEPDDALEMDASGEPSASQAKKKKPEYLQLVDYPEVIAQNPGSRRHRAAGLRWRKNG